MAKMARSVLPFVPLVEPCDPPLYLLRRSVCGLLTRCWEEARSTTCQVDCEWKGGWMKKLQSRRCEGSLNGLGRCGRYLAKEQKGPRNRYWGSLIFNWQEWTCGA